MTLTGGCFCGRVRYAIDRPLGPGRSCHCSRCRKAFSGSGSAYSEVEPGSFQWTAGEDELSRHETAPGWGLCFCRNCGSTLCGTGQGAVHGVTLGTVDGDPGVEIELHLFVDSRAPWDHIGGEAPRYAEMPPASDDSEGE
ncbi:MAG: GFA family protein [Acidobacteria bacterium]|mgnify:CR=1 FL=1|nr:MAG: GFA family protein [Acidobacteriota bacterium]REK08804.1 MAG: GFA family protein [Acidobacteriota bacterium]